MIRRWIEQWRNDRNDRKLKLEVVRVCKECGHQPPRIAFYLSEQLKGGWTVQQVCDWLIHIPDPDTYRQVVKILTPPNNSEQDCT